MSDGLTAVIRDAARGRLPDWTEATPARRAHMERVADLMGEWARDLHLDETGVERWRAAGWLHDALRDAPAERLLPWIDGGLESLPSKVWHGPATAARLERGGCLDGDLLDAIRFHTLGHRSLGLLGRALIAADYIEPGRKAHAEWRAALRARARKDLDGVVRTVVRAKLEYGLEAGLPLGLELVELWNTLARDEKA
jgi:HD superfamily phosphohydrolase YqeK